MVIMMLPVPRAIALCDQPTMRRRGAILEQLEPDRAAGILDGLSADERPDIIQQMSQHARRRVLTSGKISGSMMASIFFMAWSSSCEEAPSFR